jgi:putative membrane protein
VNPRGVVASVHDLHAQLEPVLAQLECSLFEARGTEANLRTAGEADAFEWASEHAPVEDGVVVLVVEDDDRIAAVRERRNFEDDGLFARGLHLAGDHVLRCGEVAVVVVHLHADRAALGAHPVHPDHQIPVPFGLRGQRGRRQQEGDQGDEAHSPQHSHAGATLGCVRGFLVRTLICALGLWLAARFVDGIHIEEDWTLLLAAILLGLANAVVRPIVVVLTFPITLVTLGLFLFVVNAAMLLLVAWMLDGFVVDGWWAAFFGWVIVGLTSWIASSFVGPRGDIEIFEVRR